MARYVQLIIIYTVNYEFCKQSGGLLFNLINALGRNSSGVVANVLECDIIVRKFETKLRSLSD